MRRPILLLFALAAAGCAPKPQDLLTSALATAAATPHSFTGKAARTVSSNGQPLVVSWEVKGTFEAPYAQLDLKGLAGTRTSIGREGWWVEPYEGLWRAYPPPYESIEWLDPGALTALPEYGPDQVVAGVPCQRIFASHPAGKLTFDVSKKDRRLMRVLGGTSDGHDVYEFDLTFDWSGGKVALPEGARAVLEALRGNPPPGDDAAAREAVKKGWSGLAGASLIATTIQIDFVNASEVHRRSGYLEQAPPLRAWNLTDGDRQAYIFSDGTRAAHSETPSSQVTEMPKAPTAAMDELEKMLVTRAVFAGECEHRGTKCRLVAAEVKAADADPAGSGASALLWIAPDGRLMRQIIVAKAQLAGGGTRELTNYADFTFRPDATEGDMRLVKRAKEIFGR